MRQLRDEPDERREAMEARAREVAEDLQGTCKSLEDESTEEERDNADFCRVLDGLVLLCETCGWWCEASEMCSSTNCDDCCPEACGEDAHDDEEE